METYSFHEVIVREATSYPNPNNVVRKDWKKFQGPPSMHFILAKANGYDFYVTSDHFQKAVFQPINSDKPAWLATKREAAEATDRYFVALAGFEYFENSGPGGKGHTTSSTAKTT